MSLPLLLSWLACAEPPPEPAPSIDQAAAVEASPFDPPPSSARTAEELHPWGLPVLGSAVPDGTSEPTPLTKAQQRRSDAVIAEARRHLDVGYRWEGRNTERLPGFDCLGILYRSYGKVTGTSWKSYSVNPSDLVASGKLGVAVSGVGGVLRAEVPVANLMPGDVLYLLDPAFKIKDEPLMVRDGQEYWPWHTAMYLGEGEALHADPRSVVRTQPLEELYFVGLYATRLP